MVQFNLLSKKLPKKNKKGEVKFLKKFGLSKYVLLHGIFSDVFNIFGIEKSVNLLNIVLLFCNKIFNKKC